jgi:hypothetical protein
VEEVVEEEGSKVEEEAAEVEADEVDELSISSKTVELDPRSSCWTYAVLKCRGQPGRDCDAIRRINVVLPTLREEPKEAEKKRKEGDKRVSYRRKRKKDNLKLKTIERKKKNTHTHDINNKKHNSTNTYPVLPHEPVAVAFRNHQSRFHQKLLAVIRQRHLIHTGVAAILGT